MHSFITTFVLLAVASLALANFAPIQNNALSERGPILEDPTFEHNVLRRCVEGCSSQVPVCPTCPDGLQCALSPATCDACASVSCVRGPDSSTSTGLLRPTPSSDISSILPTASAPANATFTGAGTSAIFTQSTGFPVFVAAAGIAVCFL